MRVGLALLLCAGTASADEVRATATAPAPSRHLGYVELLGKAGAYGVGYEYALTPRVSVGGAASFAVIREQQISTVAPYVHAALLRFGKHDIFGELGAELVHSHIPSPVDDWDGMSDTGAGGFASIGWQRSAKHIVLRASGTVVAGEGGLGPWAGIAIGFRP